MTKAHGNSGKLRPHTWVTGTDPQLHQQYTQFLRQRSQAHFRSEIWNLNFSQWVNIWGDLWQFRGRHREDYCLTREDDSQPWQVSNCQVISRKEHFRRRNGSRLGTTYRKRPRNDKN